MVPYVDIICLCHSVAILLEIYEMQHKYHTFTFALLFFPKALIMHKANY